MNSQLSFKKFFFKGLGVLLPTVLTIWIIVTAYQFIDKSLASHINSGVREVALMVSEWPKIDPEADEDQEYFINAESTLDPAYALKLEQHLKDQQVLYIDKQISELKTAFLEAQQVEAEDQLQPTDQVILRTQVKQLEETLIKEWEAGIGKSKLVRNEYLVPFARRTAMESWWNSVTIGSWPVLDLTGIIITIVIIYFAGVIFGNYLGNQLIQKLESFLKTVPPFKHVYPYVKQVVDFFFSDDKDGDGKGSKVQFSRVVAVQYPRKGLWSLGLVTGGTMQMIRDQVDEDCITVFIPSSPTPFTGYVITVPKSDAVEMPITIDDAIRFTVSGGVIVPESQIVPGEDDVKITQDGTIIIDQQQASNTEADTSDSSQPKE